MAWQSSKLTVQARYGRSPGVINTHFTDGLISRIRRWSRHAHFPRSRQRRGWVGPTSSGLLYRQRGSASGDRLPLQRLSTSATGSSDLGDSPASSQMHSNQVNLAPQSTSPANPALPTAAQHTLSPRRVAIVVPATPELGRSIVRRYTSGPAYRVGLARLIQSAFTSSSPAFTLAGSRDPSPSGIVQRQTALPNSGPAAVTPRVDLTQTAHPAQDHTLPVRVKSPAGAGIVSLAGTVQLVRRRLNPQRTMVGAPQTRTASAAVAPVNDSSRVDHAPGLALPTRAQSTGAVFRTAAQNRPNDGPAQRKVGKHKNQLVSVSGPSLGVALQKRHLPPASGQTAQATPIQLQGQTAAERFAHPGQHSIQPTAHRQARTESAAVATVSALSSDESHRPASPTQAHGIASMFRTVAQVGPNDRPIQRKIGKLKNEILGVSGPGLGVVLQKRYLPPAGGQTEQAAPNRPVARGADRTDPAAVAPVSASSREVSLRHASPTQAQGIVPILGAVAQDRPIQRKRGKLKQQPISVSGPGLGIVLQKRHLPPAGDQKAPTPPTHPQDQSAAARFAHPGQLPPAFGSSEATIPVVEGALKSLTPIAYAKRATHPMQARAGVGVMRQRLMPYQSMIQGASQTYTVHPGVQAVHSQGTMSTSGSMLADLPLGHVQRWPDSGSGSALIQAALPGGFPLANVDRGGTTQNRSGMQNDGYGSPWRGGDSGIPSAAAVQRSAANGSQPSPANDMPQTETGSSATGRSSFLRSDLNEMDLERLADKVYHIIEQRLIFERESMGL